MSLRIAVLCLTAVPSIPHTFCKFGTLFSRSCFGYMSYTMADSWRIFPAQLSILQNVSCADSPTCHNISAKETMLVKLQSVLAVEQVATVMKYLTSKLGSSPNNAYSLPMEQLPLRSSDSDLMPAQTQTSSAKPFAAELHATVKALGCSIEPCSTMTACKDAFSSQDEHMSTIWSTSPDKDVEEYLQHSLHHTGYLNRDQDSLLTATMASDRFRGSMSHILISQALKRSNAIYSKAKSLTQLQHICTSTFCWHAMSLDSKPVWPCSLWAQWSGSTLICFWIGHTEGCVALQDLESSCVWLDWG